MRAFLPRPGDPEAAGRLSRALGLHPVTSQVLVGRAIAGVEEARAFLQPSADQLREPGALPDMDRAVAAVDGALRRGTRIAVYGDYDVDGVCGTAILARALRFLGGDVRPFIPHRVDDGYGLSGDALARLAGEGCGLVVTVDNGSGRAAEVETARALGLDVVVTDHHEVGDALPPCPVLNPKRADARYPFPGLAGCGVALKLALALAERRGRLSDAPFRALLPDLLAFAAIGTIADVVPLLDENRSLVALGLRALAATRQPGLAALLEVSECAGRPVRSADVAYRLGPRLNAAGRIGSAHLALDLLLAEDAASARQLAARLDAGNRERQRIERLQAEEAFALAERALAERPAPALVLAGEGWHPGVIGIVAARVAETFRLPAALITVDGAGARGSARSHGGVRLHEALARCAEHLLTHGGHAFAAGFTMRADAIGAFRESFLRAVAEQTPEAAGPTLVDAELPIDAIDGPLAAEIDRFHPFGAGNEEPIFCAFGVRAAGRPRLLGAGERHVAFYAAGERRSVRAVAFHMADKEPLLRAPFDLAFVLRPRDDREGVELLVREIVPA
jgi:single-stranded-DNA-specific exonuclease